MTALLVLLGIATVLSLTAAAKVRIELSYREEAFSASAHLGPIPLHLPGTKEPNQARAEQQQKSARPDQKAAGKTDWKRFCSTTGGTSCGKLQRCCTVPPWRFFNWRSRPAGRTRQTARSAMAMPAPQSAQDYRCCARPSACKRRLCRSAVTTSSPKLPSKEPLFLRCGCWNCSSFCWR